MVFRPFIAPRFDLTAQPRSQTVELPRGHVPALDAIRGLAILAVTLYRFGGGAGGAANAVGHSWLVDLGSHGVDLFFVLSGFLITGILYDAKGKEYYFRNFYMRRALRIFPLYYAAIFVTVVLLPMVGGALGEAFRPAAEAQAWLWLYGANVLQSLRGDWCLGPLNHFWSLAIEEHFYLAWPLVIYCSSRRAGLWISGGVAVFSVAARAAWLASDGNDVAAEVLTLLRMDGLALGSWLALVTRGPGGLGWLRRFAPAVFGVFGMCALATAVADRRLFGLPSLLWACASGALLVLVVAAQQNFRLQRLGASRWLQFFGKYSYGMYVFQLPLISILGTLLTAQGLADSIGSSVVGQLIYCAILFGVTTLAAVLSWHLFEKRLLVFKDRFGGAAPASNGSAVLQSISRA